MLNELSFLETSTVPVTKEQKEMEALGSEHNEMSALSTYQGVELSPDLSLNFLLVCISTASFQND